MLKILENVRDNDSSTKLVYYQSAPISLAFIRHLAKSRGFKRRRYSNISRIIMKLISLSSI